jgi:hypothetical protein
VNGCKTTLNGCKTFNGCKATLIFADRRSPQFGSEREVRRDTRKKSFAQTLFSSRTHPSSSLRSLSPSHASLDLQALPCACVVVVVVVVAAEEEEEEEEELHGLETATRTTNPQ